MKKNLVICLTAMMLVVVLTGCNMGGKDVSPSPSTPVSPIVSASPSPSTPLESGNVEDGVGGIVDDIEDKLEPSPSIKPSVKPSVKPSENVK